MRVSEKRVLALNWTLRSKDAYGICGGGECDTNDLTRNQPFIHSLHTTQCQCHIGAPGPASRELFILLLNRRPRFEFHLNQIIIQTINLERASKFSRFEFKVAYCTPWACMASPLTRERTRLL